MISTINSMFNGFLRLLKVVFLQTIYQLCSDFVLLVESFAKTGHLEVVFYKGRKYQRVDSYSKSWWALFTTGMLFLFGLLSCQRHIPQPTPLPTIIHFPTATVISPEPDQAFAPLSICISAEVNTLHPYLTTTFAEEAILGAIFDGPTEIINYTLHSPILDQLPTIENGGIEALNYQVKSGDRIWDETIEQAIIYSGTIKIVPQLSITFQLKNNLNWSDGTPLTSDDFLFAYTQIQQKHLPDKWHILPATASYQKIDDLQFKWIGVPNYLTSNPLQFLLTPLPSYTASTDIPIGWGPYQISKWQPDDYLLLTPNLFYQQPAQPQSTQVKVRFGQNRDYLTDFILGKVADSLGRTCHLILEPDTSIGRLSNLEPTTYTTLERLQTNAQARASVWVHADFVLVNADGTPTIFANLQLRQAIAHAFHPTLPDEWFDYNYLTTIVPSNHPWALEKGVWETYPFDLERADELLQTNEWIDQDGDGIREKEGEKLQIRVGYITYGLGVDTIEELTRVLRQLGMEVVLQELSFETFQDHISKTYPLSEKFKFDLIIYPSPLVSIPNCNLYMTTSVLANLFPPSQGGQLPDVQGITSFTGYSNPDFDQACFDAKRAYNMEFAKEKYQQAQQLFVADLPSLPLFVRPSVTIWRQIEGIELYPLNIPTWNIERWVFTP